MKVGNAITPRKYDCQLSRTKMSLLGPDVVNVTSHCTTIFRELTQQDGWKTQDGRMPKNVARDRALTIVRNIFSSFCPPSVPAVLLRKLPIIIKEFDDLTLIMNLIFC